MATVDELLGVARAEVGATSGAKYWAHVFPGWGYVDGNATPWCACFVSWCLARAGVACEGFPRGVAIDRRDGFSRMVEPSDLRPGDVVGFDWDGDAGGDHVGIVESRDAGSSAFVSIEGNTSGGVVARRTRHLSQVTCGVRPRYDGAASPAAQAGLLDVDGACGPLTVAAMQRLFGTPEDGVLSGQLHSEDGYRRNVWAVDYLPEEGAGSALVHEMQRWLAGLGLYVGRMDGCWGYNLSGALQDRLRQLGYYAGRIDHDFAHHSVESLQRALNDGRLR